MKIAMLMNIMGITMPLPERDSLTRFWCPFLIYLDRYEVPDSAGSGLFFILKRSSYLNSSSGFLVYELVIPGRITIYPVEGECWQSADEKSSGR
jgi:hypothetical protein